MAYKQPSSGSSFKMMGSKDSPVKKDFSKAIKKPTFNVTSKATSGKFGKTIDSMKSLADDFNKNKLHLTKKHKLYQGPKKKLSLHGQIDGPKLNSGKLSTSGGLQADFKINKKITASGGLNINRDYNANPKQNATFGKIPTNKLKNTASSMPVWAGINIRL